LGVKEFTEIIFRVKKLAGNGEFQDGRQNRRRAPFQLAYQGS